MEDRTHLAVIAKIRMSDLLLYPHIKIIDDETSGNRKLKTSILKTEKLKTLFKNTKKNVSRKSI